MRHILVTPRSLSGSDHPAIQMLKDQGWEIVFGPRGRLPEETELLQLLPGCEGWLAGVEPISVRVLDSAKQLQVISRNGSGIDNIPLEAAKERGITVLSVAGANAQGVAELTLGLALAAARHLHVADRQLKEGKWIRSLGSELSGKPVLVVGFGKIGQRVARLLAAFGSSVSVVEPMQVATDPFSKIELAAGMRNAHLITLHCPPLPNGRPLITAELVKQSRPGLILINCARRSLVDETAVLAGLQAGQIGTYASDVFEQADENNIALIAHPQVIVTPHLGAYTKESVDRAAVEAAANLITFFADAPG
ncbi:MAG TPA: NAD(P)-dependent oxidoreductase [Chthoniobacterales bacterium]|nr:NAD(P)-dependent oxidoreductase [Chthoniobacterales bacterium]